MKYDISLQSQAYGRKKIKFYELVTVSTLSIGFEFNRHTYKQLVPKLLSLSKQYQVQGYYHNFSREINKQAATQA